MLLRTICQDLLKDGGLLLFTNIGEANPWRPLMEYGSNWTFIERSEAKKLRFAAKPGSRILVSPVRRELRLAQARLHKEVAG